MKCRQCQTEFLTANHWYVVTVKYSRKGHRPIEFVQRPLNGGRLGEGEEAVCGQNCSSKLLAEWMNGGPRQEQR